MGETTIACLRSTKSTKMRYAFHGKWHECESLFVTFGPNTTLETWLHELYPEDESEDGKKQCDVTLQVSMDKFLEGRANKEAYSVFFDYFAPVLDKKSVWMDNLEITKPEKQMLTISSEAFGLLLLENLWDCWVDQYNMSGGLVVIQKSCNIKGFNSKILPLYTKVIHCQPSLYNFCHYLLKVPEKAIKVL